MGQIGAFLLIQNTRQIKYILTDKSSVLSIFKAFKRYVLHKIIS